MTLIYERQLAGVPQSHALIIGVGSYSHFSLNGVHARDISSAVAGAKLVACWLIAHADELRPRLGTIELLLSTPGAMGATFGWTNDFAAAVAGGAADPRLGVDLVEPATGVAVKTAAARWRQNLDSRNDNTAILYVCGHGLATSTRSLVLLADAMVDPDSPWEPHIDLQMTTARMRRHQPLGQAYVFIDACQEVVSEAVLAEADKAKTLGAPINIFPPPQVNTEKNKVYGLVPGPMGSLAFDDNQGGGGRFTHILLQALDGAAASNFDGAGRWGVTTDNLHSKMKLLYSLQAQWADNAMDPTPIATLVDADPIIEFSAPPKIPVCVRFEPIQAMQVAERLSLLKANLDPVVTAELLIVPTPRPELWLAWPQAAAGAHVITAEFPQQPPWPNCAKHSTVDISEMRVRPPLVHDVR